MKTEGTNVINNSDMYIEGEEQTKMKVSRNDKKVENHRAAAAHLEAAVVHHREAAKYYAAGDNERADQSAFYAQGHHTMAGEYIKDELLHIQNNN